MTISLQDLVDETRRLVNDPDADRWSNDTLLATINEQVKRAIETGSGINTRDLTFTLADGDNVVAANPSNKAYRFQLPDNVCVLHSIGSIIASDGSVETYEVYETSLDDINLENPGWRNEDPGTPLHFMMSMPGDREFYLWPGLDFTSATYDVTVTCDVIPDDVGIPADFLGPIQFPDQFNVSPYVQLDMHPKYKEAIVNMTAVRLTEDVPEFQGTERVIYWTDRARELLGLSVQYRGARRKANET